MTEIVGTLFPALVSCEAEKGGGAQKCVSHRAP